jgi:hypothetical protein
MKLPHRFPKVAGFAVAALSLLVTPATTAHTCTFHISIETSVSTGYPTNAPCCVPGPTGFYQFLVDGAAPTIGPTTKKGDYIFEQKPLMDPRIPIRQTYPASVLATVTNSSSNNHSISVKLGCEAGIYGCHITAHSTTMRVDVFEP